MRLIFVAIVVFPCTAGVLQGQVLPLPEGRVIGGIVQDDGSAIIATAKNWRTEGETTALIWWNGSSARTAEVLSDYALGTRFLPDGGFVLTYCPPMFDGDNHCDPVHKVYRMDETGTPRLSGEWDPRNMPNPNPWFDGSSSISSDGTAWIAMRGLGFGADAFPVPTPRHTWLAYNLRNLLPGSEPPSEPFRSVSVDPASAFSGPHPHRGFVEVRSGSSGYRVVHSWRGPDSEERQLSKCQSGAPGGANFVSSNGRHAVIIEKEADLHQARRIELRPVDPIADVALEECSSESTRPEDRG